MSNIIRVASEKMLGDPFQKMVKHFQTFHFLYLNKDKINFGHNGERVKENILNEWLLSNSVMCDEPSFLAPSSASESDLWKRLFELWSKINVHPCSIIVKEQVDDAQRNSAEVMEDAWDENEKINSYFKQVSGLKLLKYFFCSPQIKEDQFSKLQRQRHLWWKKFSASPGRFSISGITRDGETQAVDIIAEFPWGNTSVENIKLFNAPHEGFSFIEPESQKKLPLSVVCCEMMLDTSVLTFLCDSFEVIKERNGANMMRFHKKIAPFKISFSVTASTETDEANLKDLAQLLAKQIRKQSTSVLLLPDICSAPLEEQIFRNDSLGIPYTVIMGIRTLTDGILGIRSRDTTIQEQSHVGSLIAYVANLMKNY